MGLKFFTSESWFSSFNPYFLKKLFPEKVQQMLIRMKNGNLTHLSNCNLVFDECVTFLTHIETHSWKLILEKIS